VTDPLAVHPPSELRFSTPRPQRSQAQATITVPPVVVSASPPHRIECRTCRDARSDDGVASSGSLDANPEGGTALLDGERAGEEVDPFSIPEALLDGASLDAFVEPWLDQVEVAISPILTRAGLSLDARIDLVLSDPDLSAALVDAALVATRSAPRPPMVEGRASRAAGDELPEVGMDWLKRTRDGTPCYPDIPPYEHYHPKCDLPDPQDGGPATPWDCLGDPDILAALARLESFRHFTRLPSSFQGLDYASALRTSIGDGVLDRSVVYSCARYFPGSFAAYDRKGDKHIHLPRKLATLSPLGDLLSLLNGGRDFRAGILLHEHVHRVDDQVFGRSGRKLLSGLTRCPATEYRAGFLQGKYYGANDCTADLIGRTYARSTECMPVLSFSQQAIAAFEDLFRCTTSTVTLLAVLAAISAAMLSPIAFATALSMTFPADVLVLFAWVVLL
jgi:hypothetical protein